MLFFCNDSDAADFAFAVFKTLYDYAHEELDAYKVANYDEKQIYIVPPDLIVPYGLHINA